MEVKRSKWRKWSALPVRLSHTPAPNEAGCWDKHEWSGVFHSYCIQDNFVQFCFCVNEREKAVIWIGNRRLESLICSLSFSRCSFCVSLQLDGPSSEYKGWMQRKLSSSFFFLFFPLTLISLSWETRQIPAADSNCLQMIFLATYLEWLTKICHRLLVLVSQRD